jgi:hypothetical protein
MSTLVAQTISNGTVSTSSANVIQGSAKAWVNYNCNTAAILASYNVSSVTNNGSGLFTINFTNALTDANYAATSGVLPDSNGLLAQGVQGYTGGTKTSSAYQIYTRYQTGGTTTFSTSFTIFLAFFR